MIKKGTKKGLIFGYAVLVTLLAADFLIFYKLVLATGNVALSIEVANNHSNNFKMAGFIASVFVLSYFVYRYFIKDESKL